METAFYGVLGAIGIIVVGVLLFYALISLGYTKGYIAAKDEFADSYEKEIKELKEKVEELEQNKETQDKTIESLRLHLKVLRGIED